MTNNDELALALLIWKNYRQKHCLGRAYGCNNIDIAEHILDLAKSIGVKDEFLNLMMDVPVMEIKITELEKWNLQGSSQLPEELGLSIDRPESKSKPKKGRKKSPASISLIQSRHNKSSKK
jgi:hypothetical protein